LYIFDKTNQKVLTAPREPTPVLCLLLSYGFHQTSRFLPLKDAVTPVLPVLNLLMAYFSNSPGSDIVKGDPPPLPKKRVEFFMNHSVMDQQLYPISFGYCRHKCL